MSSRHEVRMSKNHLHRSTSIYIDLPKSSRNDPGIVPEWSQCLDRCYGAGYLCNSWLLTLRSTSKNQELRYTMIHRLDLAISCEILRPLGSPGSNTPGSCPHRDDRRSPSEDATDVDVWSRSESESMRYWVTNLCAVPSLKYLKCHVRCWYQDIYISLYIINYNYMACICIYIIYWFVYWFLYEYTGFRTPQSATESPFQFQVDLCEPAPTASTCFDMLRHASASGHTQEQPRTACKQIKSGELCIVFRQMPAAKCSNTATLYFCLNIVQPFNIV